MITKSLRRTGQANGHNHARIFAQHESGNAAESLFEFLDIGSIAVAARVVEDNLRLRKAIDCLWRIT
ncbi:MAG: hypothetical protein WAJ96_00200 [Candidatus Acidiferrum sp.]